MYLSTKTIWGTLSFLLHIKDLKAGCQWHMPVILGTWKAETGRIKVQGHPSQIVPDTPSPKITREKWTGSVAQVVEHLLCRYKALTPSNN
jgi:hypothetical protein